MREEISGNYNIKWRYMPLLAFSVFMSYTFPRSGISTGELPITVPMVLFVLCAVLNARWFLHYPIDIKYILFLVIILPLVTITIMLNRDDLPPRRIAYLFVVLLSPLTFFLGKNLNLEKASKIITTAMLIVSIYSLIQFIFGVETTSIQGLTVAYGDDPHAKNIYRSFGISKIPSTYHNGSILAPSLIIQLAFLLQFRRNDFKTWAAIIMGTIALVLSGSRSSLFALGVVLAISLVISPFIVKGMKRRSLKLLSLFVLILPFLAYLLGKYVFPKFIEQVYRSTIGFTLTDPTFSGRTILLEDLIELLKRQDFWGAVRIFFVGADWGVGRTLEGLLYVFKYYGFVIFALYSAYMLTFFYRFRNMHWLFLGLLAVTISFYIDGPVFYPPTLTNLYIILGVCDNHLASQEIRDFPRDI